MKKCKDNKKLKKIIVNSLTATRLIGAVSVPFLFNVLSAPLFIGVVALIFFTDFLDGALAKKKTWNVSTIFGSFLDMGADKVFNFVILGILSSMYPAMRISLLFELMIPIINSKSAKHGAVAKSSEIGRFKTVILGLSICTLFLTGLSPELIQSLESLKVNDVSNTLINFFNGVLKNKETIEVVAQTAAITSEAMVIEDYAIKALKQVDKNSKKYRMLDYLTKKEYLKYMKKVLLDEKYYQETKDMSMYEKLTPPEYREEVKVKKLIPDKK